MRYQQTHKSQGSLSRELLLFVDEHRSVEEFVIRLEKWMEQAFSESEKGSDLFFGEIQEVERGFNQELFYHLTREEQGLFPLLGKYIGTDYGTLYIMLQEREVLRNNYAMMVELWETGRSSVLSERDLSQLKWACKDFLQILRAHIEKEDQELFPMAEKLLTTEEKSRLKVFMEQPAGF